MGQFRPSLIVGQREGLNATNAAMDQSNFINCLLILLGLLCLQNCGANISLKLEKERRQSRRDYIPTVANPSADNIIVKEEIYQVQEQIQPVEHFSHSQHRHNQGFSNSNSDSSRYQIFKVHNHYEAPTIPTKSAEHAMNTANYLPPPVAHEEEIHIHTTSTTNTNSPTSFEDDNLDVSYLAYGSSKFEPHGTQHATPQTVSSTHGVAATFSSNYPHGVHQQTYQASNYLAPHFTAQKVQASPLKPNYMAPAYLPPLGQHNGVQHQQHQLHQKHQQQQQHNELQQHQQHQHISPAAKQPLTSLNYAGPSYLPPTHGQTQQRHVETHGQTQQGHVETHDQSHQEHLKTHRQAQQGHVESLTRIQQQNHHQYRAPGYLPPGYDFANPEEHSQQQQPVQHEQQQIPGNLPSDYDFNNPKVHHQQQQNEVQEIPNVPMQEYRAPGYLPPGYNMQSTQQPTQYVSNDAEPTAASGNELPDGYDFVKPENAEEAIAELHSLQTQTMLLSQQRSQNPVEAIAELHSLQTQKMLLNQQGSQTPVAHGVSTDSIHSTSVQRQQQPYRGAPHLSPSPTTLHSLSGGHQHHEHHQTAIAVAPIYRDHQIVSYAPTQPHYVAQQNLQNLMPEDVQPKVRTIQIIKPNAIKTLRVLETLSHDGVKTIKILGSSQGQPTGIPQQVVNVISQQASHDISQVIKVYNDEHQESAVVQPLQQQQQQQQLPPKTNGYLPPAINHRRNLARQTYKRQFHQNH